ncbi:hypothetical protein PYCC9005_001789 [Savitreella phatthalungensis]
MAGLAPAPFAGMILADLGADVVRVDRKTGSDSKTVDSLTRGKRSIALDLKNPADKSTLLSLAAKADVLIEGYRPGVMESLGLGPLNVHAVNPSLVYARLTGFERHDPVWGKAAGHDINYIALSGLLSLIGSREMPIPPGPMLGDMAGGGMACVLGILAALVRRSVGGREIGSASRQCGGVANSAIARRQAEASNGIVVEAAMQDGAAYLATFYRHARAGDRGASIAGKQRGHNVLDGGAPFYRCYACKAPSHPDKSPHAQQRQFVAVGCIEPHFYSKMLELLGIKEDDESLPSQFDSDRWDELAEIFARKFAEKTRDEWAEIFLGSDACVTPVIEEVQDRRVPVVVDGHGRYNWKERSAGMAEDPGMVPGHGQDDVLREWVKGSKL